MEPHLRESTGLARSRTNMSRWLRLARDHGRAGEIAVLARMSLGVARTLARDTASLEALLFRRGRYLHRIRSGGMPSYRMHPFDLPAGCRTIGNVRFTVDLDKIITYCGFSYATGGWSPGLALLEEYDRNPSLRYKDSILHRLYERFTPATVQEAIFDRFEEPLTPLDRLPATHSVLKSLWMLDRRTVDRLGSRVPHRPVFDGHSRFMGPKSIAEGTMHFERFLAVYESVRKHGYQPARFGGGTAEGFFLVRDGDYRFVASRINHRVPALRHLGVRRIVARPLVRHPPVVDEEHLHRWSTDHGGPYPMPVVRRLFDQMFTSTGTERARTLRLI